MSTQASKTKFGNFEPIVGTTGATVYVLWSLQADYPTSMKLLSDAQLRPLSYQESIPLLMKDESLKNALKGKWFWLAGQGMDKDGLFTIDDKGELREIGNKEKLSVEQKVYILGGEQPLSFDVRSDYDTAYNGRRFILVAISEPHVVAPVVVGVPINRETAAPDEDQLRAQIREELKEFMAAPESTHK